jgi:hypothetical protein
VPHFRLLLHEDRTQIAAANVVTAAMRSQLATLQRSATASPVSPYRLTCHCALLTQALYAHATSPLKMVGMMGFMMYMSGSQLHIFSIMTTLSGVYQPLSAILSSGSGGPPNALCFRCCSICTKCS